MKIETERLILREFRDDDYDALREIHSDPEVFRYRSRACFDEAMTRGFLTRAQRAICEEPRNAYAFAITLREDGLLIGECGMNRVDSGCNETYLWNSLNRRFWRQGYMTESLKGRELPPGTFRGASLRIQIAANRGRLPFSSRL